jgi:hypothetical protein
MSGLTCIERPLAEASLHTVRSAINKPETCFAGPCSSCESAPPAVAPAVGVGASRLCAHKYKKHCMPPDALTVAQSPTFIFICLDSLTDMVEYQGLPWYLDVMTPHQGDLDLGHPLGSTKPLGGERLRTCEVSVQV